MRSLLTAIALLLIAENITAQAPQKMSYQAVIRNGSNVLIINQAIGMRISILQGSINGNAIFVETHTPTTNDNGAVSIEVGAGSAVSGVFSGINWENGPYFIKTETDPAGGTNYSISGTSQLLSVPYALSVPISFSSFGDTLFVGGRPVVVPRLNSLNQVPSGITTSSCGAPDVLNPSSHYGTVIDQDGNSYKTVVIGAQEWMAENLKVRRYRNGDSIPLVTVDTVWANLNSGATCWYNNDSIAYDCPNGKLYNWYAVTDPRHLCPVGWHEPVDIEWNRLFSYLGGPYLAPVALKSTGSQYWVNHLDYFDNSSGFSALALFNRSGTNGAFISSASPPGSISFWSASNTASTMSSGFFIDNRVLNGTGPKRNGNYIRCVKD